MSGKLEFVYDVTENNKKTILKNFIPPPLSNITSMSLKMH
ncbi:hypothetical protein PLUTE_b0775 [Pseudoalteromonas luteoviolacea DSM 6061]|nr:hypothetical protein [Pseudoalteromonas luteoviolacea DSM 6061]